MTIRSFEQKYRDAITAVDTTNPIAQAALAHLNQGRYEQAYECIRDLNPKAQSTVYRAAFYMAASRQARAAPETECTRESWEYHIVP